MPASIAVLIAAAVPVSVVAAVAATLLLELVSMVFRSAAATEPASTVAVIVAAA